MYDALLVSCALKSSAAVVYSWKVRRDQGLSPEIVSRRSSSERGGLVLAGRSLTTRSWRRGTVFEYRDHDGDVVVTAGGVGLCDQTRRCQLGIGLRP